MTMYDYIMQTKGKYEDLHTMSFYESISGDLCKYCKHSVKGMPADKCTNVFCWRVVDQIMRAGKPQEEEQLSLF